MNKENIFKKILILISISFVFIYTIIKLKYSVISNDDIVDFIVKKFTIYHGRFFTTYLQLFFIKTLPNFLNINYQDFAIISHASLKSIFITLLDICFVLPIIFFIKNKNKYKDYISSSFLLLGYFIFITLIINLHFNFGIEIAQFFYGYIFPIPFFIIFWFQTFKYFVVGINITKSNFILYILLLIFSVTTNEEILNVTFVMLFLIFITNLLKSKFKINKKSQKLLLSIFITLFIIFITYKSEGLNIIISGYNLSIIKSINLSSIYKFMNVFTNRLFTSVYFLWMPIILMIIYLKLINKNNKMNKKINNYILISYISFFLFFGSLFFLGESFTYENYCFYHMFPKYWILHPGLLMCFYGFLVFNNFFLLSYILRISNIRRFLFFYSIFLIFSIPQIKNNIIFDDFADLRRKEVLYIADKMSYFYFSKMKPAVISVEGIDLILPTYNNHFPKDLEDTTGESYKNKIYRNLIYLEYINKTYNIDTTPGIMFVPYEQALEIFEQNGGTLTKEELNELKFSKIKQQFVEKEN